MLQPKKTKYRKAQKGRMSSVTKRGNLLAYGTFGIKSLEASWVTSRQIEAARIAATRYMKREGKVWIRIFPYLPITSKPTESRMGKGKGSVSHWVSRVKSGTTLFEVCGVPKHIAKEALKSSSAKLPIKTCIFD